jgi:RNA polymerase sigma factor (sigma-70 family)
MTCQATYKDDERARRFRDVALPYLDDAYTLARFLLRDRTDAEDAVQECYLRALRYFDGWRGTDFKPWLLAILRNVCNTEFNRRGRRETPADPLDNEHPEQQPLWQEPQAAPDSGILASQQRVAVQQLVAALPEPFREAIVLREFNDMSYREIADVTGVPVGTVMSRLARARAMLLAGWKARDSSDETPATAVAKTPVLALRKPAR